MYAQGDYIKVEFRGNCSGEIEWMWVRVDSDDLENRVVFGTLDNEAVASIDLRLGMRLAVSTTLSANIVRRHLQPNLKYAQGVPFDYQRAREFMARTWTSDDKLILGKRRS